jgi:hypothetical protein
MNSLIPVVAALLFAGPATAQNAVCRGSGPAEECQCPGNRKLHLSIYAPTQTEFYLDQMGNANRAYGKFGVGVVDVKRGMLLNVARVRTGRDPDLDPCFGEALQRIHDVEDMCIVIKEAISREPPPPGSLPVFMLLVTNADSLAAKKAGYRAKIENRASDSKCTATLKDLDQMPDKGFVERFWTQLGSEANAVMMGHGLKASCDGNDVSGLPDTPLVLVNLDPGQPHAHVLAHEVGHAIGFLAKNGSGKDSKAIDQFPDIEPPNDSIHNIMVTKRAVKQQELEDNRMLNPFQAKQLCGSTLLGN